MQTSFRSGMSSRGGGATGGGPNEQHSSGIDSYGSNGPNQNQLVDVSSYSSSMSQVGIDGQLDPIDRYFERKRAEPNPFVIPDEDIFALREREKAEKAQQRELNMTTKIWDKTSTNPDAIKISQIRETRAKARTTVLGKGGDRPLQPRRRESENMAEFIAKKREMFLIKMSLATKRQEILKLDEKAKLKEKTLRDAERKLEEDALSFDQFLKENDNKAHQAIKAAEDATKRKQDMAQRVKHLRAEVEKVEAEIQKTDMLLRNCEKYKTFLDQRAPPEFREKVERMKQEAEEKRAQRAKMRAIAQLTNSSNNNEGGAMVLHGDGGLVPVSTALTESGSNNALMGMDEEEDDDLDYIPMYFERPDQLLEVFSQLEASNLKLIQAVQEKEGMLEALRQRFSEAKASMFAKSDQLAANIADLKSRVREERARSQGLALREQSYYAGGDQSKMLESLTAKVREVAKKHINIKTHTDPIVILRELENVLESTLAKLAKIASRSDADKEAVRAEEKVQEEKRRQDVKRDKLLKASLAGQEKMDRTRARSMAQVPQRPGKPIMFRSAPIVRKKKEEVKVERNEAAEEERRLYTVDW